MKRLIAATCLGAVAFALTGCIGHYRITDPASGDVFYTREWVTEGDDKTETRFEDVLTDKVYLVTNAKIEKIGKDDYAAATE